MRRRFIINIKSGIPNQEIWYSSTDREIVKPYAANVFGAIIKNNIYNTDSNIGKIIFDKMVTSIGDSAFYGCSSLTSVTIPDSVTSIGDSAFYYCSSLTSVTIPDSVTSIGDSAFYYCTSLTSVTIPDSVISIGNSAFQDCGSLADVKIGKSVTSIGELAFCYCSSLTSVTIPDSVTSIGELAFSVNPILESIEFGNGEIYFDSRILSECTSLKKMIFHGLNPSIYEGTASSSFFNIGVSGISVYYPTEDTTYITKVIDYLDTPATADVNNFFPVTLVSGTTTVIGKELYDKYADRSNGSFTLDGSVTVDGIVYTSARMLRGTIYFGTYPLTSDGYLQGGPA